MTRTSLYVLCAILISACVWQRKEPRTQLALDIPLDVGIGVTDRKQELPEDWESRFKPAGGSMRVDEEPGVSLALGVQPEFRQYLGSGWIGGALVKYQLRIPGGINENLCMKTLHWWNPVTIQTLYLQRWPAAGFLIARNMVHEQQLRLQVTSFYYELGVVDYQGVDVYGGENTSEATDKNVVRNDFGFGVGLDYRPPDAYYGRMGCYLDRAGNAWSFGIGWRWTLPFAMSKSTIPIIY